MKTQTIKADVVAPNNYPFEFIERDLVVQIFSQIEPYITFTEMRANKDEKIYMAQVKVVLNERGDN